MNTDIIDMLEGVGTHGHSPVDGCALFGVGYEDAFNRIEKTYLNRRLARGSSAEKFVVGPYGSGKTHFLRELMERGRRLGFVTSEVSLNKEVEYDNPLLVYKEIVRELRMPGASDRRGIRPLLGAAYELVERDFIEKGGEGAAEALMDAWVEGLDSDFPADLVAFARVLRRAYRARRDRTEDDPEFVSCCRWLEGDVSNRDVAKASGESTVPKAEHGIHAKRCQNSLYQFIRYCGFPGTIVAFDEAEQSLNADRRRLQRIHSMLQSDINRMSDLRKGSVFVVYAITPDVAESFMEFPALKQRLQDPVPERGFFEGDTLAPLIRLDHRGDPLEHLRLMGRRLVALFYEIPGLDLEVGRTQVEDQVEEFASSVAVSTPSASNRREMAKRTCNFLVRLYDGDALELAAASTPVVEEDDEE